MRFVFRTPKGGVFVVQTATRREAVATAARYIPGSAYLGPVAPHMVLAILTAKPATPEELRVMRRVLPAEPRP